MNRTLVIGLLALVVVIAGAFVAMRPFLKRSAPSKPPAPPTAEELNHPDSDVVARAMAGVPLAAVVDSSAFKSRWLDPVRGMDLTSLSATQREIFLRFANSEYCTCGCGYTLAGCRESDMSCEISGPRLDALMDSVRTGKIRSARGVRARPTGG